MTNENHRSSSGIEAPDRVFEALSHPLRRRILASLAGGDANDRYDAETLLPSDANSSCWIELDHNHLPRLDEAGFVDWDRERGTVGRGARFEAVRPFLDPPADYPDDPPDDPFTLRAAVERSGSAANWSQP